MIISKMKKSKEKKYLITAQETSFVPWALIRRQSTNDSGGRVMVVMVQV
jgi:hypothetical protein